jgi:Ran GTPase-activating protein (RanGAP) involved in mRNA processing and transport
LEEKIVAVRSKTVMMLSTKEMKALLLYFGSMCKDDVSKRDVATLHALLVRRKLDGQSCASFVGTYNVNYDDGVWRDFISIRALAFQALCKLISFDDKEKENESERETCIQSIHIGQHFDGYDVDKALHLLNGNVMMTLCSSIAAASRRRCHGKLPIASLSLASVHLDTLGTAALASLLRSSSIGSLTLDNVVFADTHAFQCLCAAESICDRLELIQCVVGDASATPLPFDSLNRMLRGRVGAVRQLRLSAFGATLFGDGAARTLASALPDLMALELLELNGNGITDVGACAIAKALRDEPLPALAMIALDANSVGSKGACALASVAGSLRAVSLDNNRVGSRGASALALRVHSLSLAANRVRADATITIADAAPSALTALNLAYNVRIGADGARALAAALAQRRLRLRTLSLASCGIDVSNVADEALGAAVRSSDTLRSLALDYNAVDVTHIADALGNSSCAFAELSVRNVGLTRAAAERLAAAALASGTLERLCALSNSDDAFGDDTLCATLVAAARGRAQLQRIDVERCDANAEQWDALRVALAVNTRNAKLRSRTLQQRCWLVARCSADVSALPLGIVEHLVQWQLQMKL